MRMLSPWGPLHNHTCTKVVGYQYFCLYAHARYASETPIKMCRILHMNVFIQKYKILKRKFVCRGRRSHIASLTATQQPKQTGILPALFNYNDQDHRRCRHCQSPKSKMDREETAAMGTKSNSVAACEKNDPVTSEHGGSVKLLVVCFVGIFVSYFIYALLQEKM